MRALLAGGAAACAACGGDPGPATPAEPPPSMASPAFCVPALLSPSPGATVDNGCTGFSDVKTWDFSWSACPGADAYHLFVQHVGSARPVVDDATLSTTAYRDQGVSYVADGNRFDWRWRVRSRRQGVWSDWASERSFDVEPLDTDCPLGPTQPLPQQLSPANGTVFSHFPRSVTLVWTAAAGAVRYGVEVDCYHCCGANRWCTDVGRTWVVDTGVRVNSYSFEFAGAQAGRWRVWAIDAAGREGPRTDWWEFRFTV